MQLVNASNGSIADIVGGQVLPEGKRHYLASIGSGDSGPFVLDDTEKEGHACGASLIHPNVALTAASCVTERMTDAFSPQDWIDFKRYDLTSGLDGVDRRELSQTEGEGTNYVQRYPDFVSPFGTPISGNDVAIICLDQPVEDVEPVKLNSDPKIPVDNSTLEAFGWG